MDAQEPPWWKRSEETGIYSRYRRSTNHLTLTNISHVRNTFSLTPIIPDTSALLSLYWTSGSVNVSLQRLQVICSFVPCFKKARHRSKGSESLLSHIIVIPAKAGIQRLLGYIAFNYLLDTRFRGYDIFFILDFHVHLQLEIICSLLLQC